MRKVLILGATGSIGTTALNAIRDGKLKAQVTGLVAFHNEGKLRELSKEFSCSYILNTSSEILKDFIFSHPADIALNGIAGAAGLEASLLCLYAGMDLALANKESVVMGGKFLFSEAERMGRKIIPVDSEHSAIYHLIQDHRDVDSLVITASGGPFFGRKDLDSITPEEAANHPTWKMGRKISIDSSTLANKGLEVIEAGFLFDMSADRVEVTVHRQSVVHSMIRLTDGSVYAQLSPPDMTLPIVSAVNDGHHELHDIVSPLSFSDLTLTFQKWSEEEFPLLSLAYTVLKKKASFPIAYNAADEVAVQAFIDGKIKYTDIARVVKAVIDTSLWTKTCTSYTEIMEADALARKVACECLLSF